MCSIRDAGARPGHMLHGCLSMRTKSLRRLFAVSDFGTPSMPQTSDVICGFAPRNQERTRMEASQPQTTRKTELRPAAKPQTTGRSPAPRRLSAVFPGPRSPKCVLSAVRGWPIRPSASPGSRIRRQLHLSARFSIRPKGQPQTTRRQRSRHARDIKFPST